MQKGQYPNCVGCVQRRGVRVFAGSCHSLHLLQADVIQIAPPAQISGSTHSKPFKTVFCTAQFQAGAAKARRRWALSLGSSDIALFGVPPGKGRSGAKLFLANSGLQLKRLQPVHNPSAVSRGPLHLCTT